MKLLVYYLLQKKVYVPVPTVHCTVPYKICITNCMNYEAKIEAGTGAGPKRRLRLQLNTLAPGGCGSETLVKCMLHILCFYSSKPAFFLTTFQKSGMKFFYIQDRNLKSNEPVNKKGGEVGNNLYFHRVHSCVLASCVVNAHTVILCSESLQNIASVSWLVPVHQKLFPTR